MADARLFNALVRTRDIYVGEARKLAAAGDMLGALEAQGIANGVTLVFDHLDTLATGEPVRRVTPGRNDTATDERG